MDKYLVSLVIASKDPDPLCLIRCISSFAALKYSQKIQLIIVESGVSPEIPQGLLLAFAAVHRLHVHPEGVYAAYNKGAHISEGTYVLFFGIDDIALPGMDQIFRQLETSSHMYSLFAASCYMESHGLRNPSSKRVALLFSNWCHQGILYSRRHLPANPYNKRYKMQADHALNISISSNKENRIEISKILVAYFSAGGISSEVPDLIFRNDLPSIAKLSYGRFWGYAVRAKQIFASLLLGSPASRFKSRKN